MTRKYFGTDGIRGTVGQAPITPDFVLRLAHAVGRVLKQTEAHPTVLIGQRHPHLWLYVGVSAGVWFQFCRRQCGVAWSLTHTRCGLPHTRPTREPWRGHQCQSQPVC